ncbi:MAG: AMP-binding protein [Acidimicrobiales bacterium]
MTSPAPAAPTGTPGCWAPHLEDPGSFDPSRLADGGTLPAVWASRWQAVPSAPVLFMGDAPGGHHLGAGCPRWWGAAEIESATRRAAGQLAGAGLAPGERLVWSGSAASIVACLAALRLGAVVVPANPAYTERELGHVAGDVRPAVAVVDRPEQADWVAAAAPGIRAVLAPDLSPLAGPGLPDATADAPLDRAAPEDPALVVYTSGTTGAPKGAVITHANLLAWVRTLALAWRWEEDDRLVLSLPLFHVHGLCAGLFGTLAAGASAVVLPRFSPEGVLDAAAEGGTLFFGVPTMYHRLLASGRAGELSRLRLCVSGSAPLPAPMWHELRRSARVAVLERYGMTETGLTVSNPFSGERRPGTVGFPLPGVSGRVVPMEAAPQAGPGAPPGGNPAGGGGEGQLLVAGPTVFAGYWERPAATEAAFDGAWFRTGDVVAADGDGYLTIRGRRHDVVISGGLNVYPAEVEDVLLTHPGVAEVAVAGEPSDEWGEEVVAWIVPAGKAPATGSLEELAAGRLAPYKRPRRYRVVDALPRNAMGKVQRDRLRE